MLNKRCRNKQN